ncbi:hypothetical protein TWF569_002804 [Orbilia oligospora]|nr:hypothetical protein TWF569_002804 [Orbilia oligospora]
MQVILWLTGSSQQQQRKATRLKKKGDLSAHIPFIVMKASPRYQTVFLERVLNQPIGTFGTRLMAANDVGGSAEIEALLAKPAWRYIKTDSVDGRGGGEEVNFYF